MRLLVFPIGCVAFPSLLIISSLLYKPTKIAGVPLAGQDAERTVPLNNPSRREGRMKRTVLYYLPEMIIVIEETSVRKALFYLANITNRVCLQAVQ